MSIIHQTESPTTAPLPLHHPHRAQISTCHTRYTYDAWQKAFGPSGWDEAPPTAPLKLQEMNARVPRNSKKLKSNPIGMASNLRVMASNLVAPREFDGVGVNMWDHVTVLVESEEEKRHEDRDLAHSVPNN